MTKHISWYARRYCEKFSLHLVPIEPRRKFPRSKDWGNNTISDPTEAEAFYKEHPDWNIGVSLGPSQMCSLDIDCFDSFKIILDEFGISPEDLEKYPTIQGASKGRRIMFRVPEGAELKYQKLNWPQKDDPKKQFTVIELRAATDGKQRQDIFPCSVHPDTGLPYKWIVQPPSGAESWPIPPDWLLSIWEAWDQFKPQFKDACPWAVKQERPEPKPTTRPAGYGGSTDVIGIYNDTVGLTTALDVYGYTQKGKRWLSPHSGTGLAGVILFPDGNTCWIHHASDPLCSEETGKPVNAFDLFCYYEHGDNVGKAVKAATKLLGIVQEPNMTANEQPPAPEYDAADYDTADYYQAFEEGQELEDGQTSEPMNNGALQVIEYASPLPYCNAKGKPLKHITNLAAICQRLGVMVRYNVISKDEEILIPNESFSLDNNDNASFAWLLSECSRFDFATDKMGEFLTYLSDKNLYNPVATWIDSTPWDGQPRLQQLLDTVTAVGENISPEVKALKETLMTRWLISAVAAGFKPDGISAQGVLVFQGPQNLGKTRWLNRLVPPQLALVKDGMILKPDDKDSVKQCCSFWLVELGELDSTFRRSDIAALKAFITNQTDVMRRAYARKESQYARRTVFFGSVNPREFLHDNTGNRRYWTIEAEAINHTHDIDMQQVWAEVKMLWTGGEHYHLSPDEMEALNNQNEGFMTADPIQERILSKLDWSADVALWRHMQTTDVLIEIGIDKPTRADATIAGQVIRARNNGESKRSNGKTTLLVPPYKRSLPELNQWP